MNLNNHPLEAELSPAIEGLKSQDGFSLIEMLIVIALMGLVGTFVVSNVMRRYEEAKVGATKVQIHQLSTMMDDYRRMCGRYPTTDHGLEALVHLPAGVDCKSYDPEGIIKKVPNDGWEHPFMFESDGNKYVIKSLGADNKPGGDGFDKDISSEDAN